jgi:hypothetical protein
MGDLVFPLVCEQCRASTVVPCYDSTEVRSTVMVLGLRCGACGHREHLTFKTIGVSMARKPDRRRNRETNDSR